MFPFASSIPYSPLIGAVNESRKMCAGCDTTSWYVPGTGSPAALKL